MFETIVALATPPMKSALAIVRVSGDDCFSIVSKCFTKNLNNLTERTAFVGSIIDNGEKVDDVVLVAYKGPKSFTGEDSLEIICHGSVLIANQIIEVLIKNGARLATNGEYSSRAFLHNKIDLIQAEAINDTINATTREAKNLSLLSVSGQTSDLIKPIKTKIADIISLIEVNIDFPEYEDIEVANKDKIISSTNEIVSLIDNLIDNGEKAKIIRDGVKVAIVGKPNVGKSSLLNALTGEDKAIVTDIAGTTRDIVEGDVNLKGIRLHLLDTAGIRKVDDKVEAIGVEKARKTIEDADLVLVVLDGTRKLDNEDQEILNATKGLNRIIVHNKNDITKESDTENVYTSALTGDVEQLTAAIFKNLVVDEEAFKQPALNNARQLGLLKHAKEALLKAKQDAEYDLTVDLISVSLLDAFNAVLEITGEANQLDLSKEIFSRFCVGK